MWTNEQNRWILLALFFSLVSNVWAAFAVDRPKLMTESFYAHRSDKQNGVLSNRSPEEDVWRRLLLAIGVDHPAPLSQASYYTFCHYDSALATLQQIRMEFGAGSLYEKLWATNQDRLFSTCDSRRVNKTTPMPPEEFKSNQPLPKRAQSDFWYQLASGSPCKSMQVDFYQRVTRIGVTNKNRQVNAA